VHQSSAVENICGEKRERIFTEFASIAAIEAQGIGMVDVDGMIAYAESAQQMTRRGQQGEIQSRPQSQDGIQACQPHARADGGVNIAAELRIQDCSEKEGVAESFGLAGPKVVKEALRDVSLQVGGQALSLQAAKIAASIDKSVIDGLNLDVVGKKFVL
jgi:hypothetical protein